MAILVTGTGLMGVHTVRELIDEFHLETVVFGTMSNAEQISEFCGGATIVRGDILNLPELVDVMRKHKVTAVVHSAVIGTDPAYAHPYAAVQTNVVGTVNVIEAAAVSGAKRVVLISSNAGSQMPEEGLNRLPVTARMFGATRIGSEQIGREYAAIRGVRFIGQRNAALYGPSIRPSMGTSARIQEAVFLAARGEPIVIKPRNNQQVEKVYSKDAARAAVLLATSAHLPDEWEWATMGPVNEDDRYSFAEVAEVLGELAGLPAKVEGEDDLPRLSYNPDRESGHYPMARLLSLGYEERYPLRVGLTHYLAWARDWHARSA